jgi:aminopeptidase N
MARRAALALVAAAACRPAPPAPPAAGVPRALAEARAATLSDLRYELDLAIPDSADQPVTGSVTIRFHASRAGPTYLDFRAPAENLHRVRVNDAEVPAVVASEHVAIPRGVRGENVVQLDFTATDLALNRNSDFMYALFVPDRARTAFPVFDQPDLKGRYRLTLRIPAAWTAVANGELETRDSAGPVHRLRFRETEPISTYLVSFAAGRLMMETATRNGRTFHLFHRETDSAKVARNQEALFDLHAAAIAWLERYTGIPYPFQKFDFFALPAFQFGGMEHPGAVWYRANTMFLDPSATRSQLLGRATVIAHETAHMWFGDLVTMRWFNDVWMKEVFANFMAGKIVEPSFPDVDHRLRFYLAHQAAAAAVDRTPGANPIRQPLENLDDAGSLYGPIIYEKAPIVMRQLELLIGEDSMRAGLREYLDRHRFGNATWPDLIAVLDRRTPLDLAAWSRAWVEEPGRPVIAAKLGADGRRLILSERDPVAGRNLRWTERLRLTAVFPDSTRRFDLAVSGSDTTIDLPARPSLLLLGTDGVGYGRFPLDSTSREWLLDRIESLPDPVERAVGWNALWEETIDGMAPVARLLTAAERALAVEPNELVEQQILGRIQEAFWRYSSDSLRRARSAELEAALWHGLERAPTPGRKAAYFTALSGVTLTPAGVARLEWIWRTRRPPPGLPLAEDQYTTLAEGLALRDSTRAAEILDEAERRITNPDRVARFRFVRRALSNDPRVRDSLFASFRDLAVRRRESWLIDANGYLNHPLRSAQSERYLRPSLDLLEEVKHTGDIFLPIGWLQSTLAGHNSAAAADIVATFLADRPDLAPTLRAKVLQTADDLFRSARVVFGWRGSATRPASPDSRP